MDGCILHEVDRPGIGDDELRPSIDGLDHPPSYEGMLLRCAGAYDEDDIGFPAVSPKPRQSKTKVCLGLKLESCCAWHE
jgi:hypothetical protein